MPSVSDLGAMTQLLYAECARILYKHVYYRSPGKMHTIYRYTITHVHIHVNVITQGDRSAGRLWNRHRHAADAARALDRQEQVGE